MKFPKKLVAICDPDSKNNKLRIYNCCIVIYDATMIFLDPAAPELLHHRCWSCHEALSGVIHSILSYQITSNADFIDWLLVFMHISATLLFMCELVAFYQQRSGKVTDMHTCAQTHRCSCRNMQQAAEDRRKSGGWEKEQRLELHVASFSRHICAHAPHCKHAGGKGNALAAN